MGTVEFKVPDKLREYGITRLILLEDCNILKAMYNGLAITATYTERDISATMRKFREDAGEVITSNGKDASDIIESLVRQMTSYISDYAENKKNNENSTVTAAAASETQSNVIELTEDLKKEVSWEEIAAILSTSIKKDKAQKTNNILRYAISTN
jgi:hypothetical protein